MTIFDLEKNLEDVRKDYRATSRRWYPLREKIRADIEHELGRKFSDTDLWMGASRDIDHIGIDYFYKTDAELHRGEESGQQQFLVEAIERATKKHIDVVPEVRFHSHQYIQEKCEGDYFRYFR